MSERRHAVRVVREGSLDLSEAGEVEGCNLEEPDSHVYVSAEAGVCAIRWEGDNRSAAEKFLRDHGVAEFDACGSAGCALFGFYTLSTFHHAEVGEWIVLPRHGDGADDPGRVLTDADFRSAYVRWVPRATG